MSFVQQYLGEVSRIVSQLDITVIESLAQLIANVRSRGGRVFFLGAGGGAANASHAVNDFRKIAGIESYTPTDNVSELTARTNDEGWQTSYVNWLKVSKLCTQDMLFIFSVGGGDLVRNVSPNLVRAIQYGKEIGCAVVGVVGRDGGYTAQAADVCVMVPTVNRDMVTPHTEEFQAVILHLLVSHPILKAAQTKWESTDQPHL